MKEQPKKEEHHGADVWVNPLTESLRREECLCLNCANMQPGQPEHCYVAQAFFLICGQENVALAVTRCPKFTPKK